VASPNNIPGGRSFSSGWVDDGGKFWLFGGQGEDSQGTTGVLNDLWAYQPFYFAATPIFSVPSGTYTTVQTVTISDTTPGATIYYYIPNGPFFQYTGPITVSSSETLVAFATAPGYTTSATAAAAYSINIPPGIAVGASPASLTVTAGQAASTTISVTPQGGFSAAVSFSCSGLPAGATCSFSPATVTPSGGTATTTLTVSTTATTAALHKFSHPSFPAFELGLALWFFGFKRWRRLQPILLLVVCTATLSLLSACGGGGNSTGGGTPPVQPVTSTITVTALSGTIRQTTTISLTVN
jgi:hypothetical protein